MAKKFSMREYKDAFLREQSYGAAVLIGNWFEDRTRYDIDKKAIAPCVYGKLGCPKESSVYRVDYAKPHGGLEHLALSQQFKEDKQICFKNRSEMHKSDIKLCDGDMFWDNMTTLYDVEYRIKPQMATNKKPILELNRLMKEDSMRSYGNSTNYGLKEWNAKCAVENFGNLGLNRSLYRDTYTCKLPFKSSKRFPLKTSSITKILKNKRRI